MKETKPLNRESFTGSVLFKSPRMNALQKEEYDTNRKDVKKKQGEVAPAMILFYPCLRG